MATAGTTQQRLRPQAVDMTSYQLPLGKLWTILQTYSPLHVDDNLWDYIEYNFDEQGRKLMTVVSTGEFSSELV